MKKTTKLAVAVAAASFGSAAFAVCPAPSVAASAAENSVALANGLTEACALGVPGGALSADGLQALIGDEITSNFTMDNTRLWVLRGKVAFGAQVSSPVDASGNFTIAEVAGPTLTVEPGTIIVGNATDDDTDNTVVDDSGNVGAANADRLIINRGGDIVADGSRDAPIRMTGLQNLDTGSTAAGQWGGLYINGYGLNNRCDNVSFGAASDFPNEASVPGGTVTNCERPGEANTGVYGGNSNDDDSGILDYVTVAYAGATFNAETDLNGIAFQSVGSGTQVSNIQVHANVDDGVEFYGGAVDATNVVLTDNQDDSFDTTEGWLGNIQYMVVVQSGASNDSVFESDTGGNESFPSTDGDVANLTVIKTNADTSRGFRLRDETSLDIFNATIVFPQGECIDSGLSAASPLYLNTSVVDGIFADCSTGFTVDAPAVAGPAIASGSSTLDGVVNGANENGATPTASLPAAFVATSFVGAVESCAANWTAGWVIPGTLPANSLGDACAPAEEAVPVMGWAGLAALFAGIAGIASRVRRVK